MMCMSVALGTGKSCHKNVGREGTDETHRVGEGDGVTTPVLKRFLGGLRESEIPDAREALLHSVVAVGRKKLKRADYTKLVEESGAEFVLTAFATSQSHEHRMHAVATGLEGEHAPVFVVRM